MLKRDRTFTSSTMPFLRGEPGSPLWAAAAAVCFVTRGLEELSLSPSSSAVLCPPLHCTWTALAMLFMVSADAGDASKLQERENNEAEFTYVQFLRQGSAGRAAHVFLPWSTALSMGKRRKQ